MLRVGGGRHHRQDRHLRGEAAALRLAAVHRPAQAGLAAGLLQLLVRVPGHLHSRAVGDGAGAGTEVLRRVRRPADRQHLRRLDGELGQAGSADGSHRRRRPRVQLRLPSSARPGLQERPGTGRRSGGGRHGDQDRRRRGEDPGGHQADGRGRRPGAGGGQGAGRRRGVRHRRQPLPGPGDRPRDRPAAAALQLRRRGRPLDAPHHP